MFILVYRVLVINVFFISYVKANCNSPPSIPNTHTNITSNPPYPEGTTARYDCDPGFNPAGTSRYYACSNTVWTGGDIRCEEIFCSYVAPPENGHIVNEPTNEVGTSIVFSCDEGHDMSGLNSMLCRTDGNWSPATPPVCTAKYCGEFGSIQYADTFQDTSETERNHYGSIVEVTCENGRVLNGPPHVKCDADGQWGDRPTCEILQCPPYPNTNSSCIKATLLSGTFYFIMCKDDISTKAGPDAAECIAGQWDNLEMKCLCDCVLPDYDTSLISISNLNNQGYLPHATALEWACVSGRTTPSDLSIMCIDGTLKAMRNGNEVNFDNNSNLFEAIHIIMSNLCKLPDTTSGSSSTMSTISTVSSTLVNVSTPKVNVTKEPLDLNEFPMTTIKTDKNSINSAVISLFNYLSISIFCFRFLFKQLI